MPAKSARFTLLLAILHIGHARMAVLGILVDKCLGVDAVEIMSVLHVMSKRINYIIIIENY